MTASATFLGNAGDNAPDMAGLGSLADSGDIDLVNSGIINVTDHSAAAAEFTLLGMAQIFCTDGACAGSTLTNSGALTMTRTGSAIGDIAGLVFSEGFDGSEVTNTVDGEIRIVNDSANTGLIAAVQASENNNLVVLNAGSISIEDTSGSAILSGVVFSWGA